MKSMLGISLLAVALLAACTSKSKARRDAQSAFQAGQLQALTQMQQQTNRVVHLRGFVKNSTIPWTEDLTVGQAIIAAEYTGLSDPRYIVIRRRNETFRLNAKDLLKGREDPVLEPGDVIEIQR